MKLVQEIHIKHFDDGTFSVSHKHFRFQLESYIVKSKIGTPPVVRNLINGFLPTLQDLYVLEGSEPTTSLDMVNNAMGLD